MSITRWDPFRDMMTLREAMQSLLEDSFVYPRGGQASQFAASGNLALDMHENENEYTITAALPGIKPEDVDISVLGNTVRIRGEFRQESQPQGAGAQEGATQESAVQGQQARNGHSAMQTTQGGATQAGGRSRWLLRERRYGTFERVLTLPTEVQANAANAQFEHGVLTLTLPKAEAAKPQAIRVNVATPTAIPGTVPGEAQGANAGR